MYYDDEQAARFIAERTGVDPEMAGRFVTVKFHYQALNFIVDTEENLAEERELYWDCISNTEEIFPKREDDSLTLRYICRVTGFLPSAVASMMAAEAAYMVTLGIVHTALALSMATWAYDIAREEQEAEDEAPVN